MVYTDKWSFDVFIWNRSSNLELNFPRKGPVKSNACWFSFYFVLIHLHMYNRYLGNNFFKLQVKPPPPPPPPGKKIQLHVDNILEMTSVSHQLTNIPQKTMECNFLCFCKLNWQGLPILLKFDHGMCEQYPIVLILYLYIFRVLIGLQRIVFTFTFWINIWVQKNASIQLPCLIAFSSMCWAFFCCCCKTDKCEWAVYRSSRYTQP